MCAFEEPGLEFYSLCFSRNKFMNLKVKIVSLFDKSYLSPHVNKEYNVSCKKIKKLYPNCTKILNLSRKLNPYIKNLLRI